MGRIFLLTHAQIVREIQRNVINQLRRDRVPFDPGIEVSFSAVGKEDIAVEITVYSPGRKNKFSMAGKKRDLLDIASNLAILEMGGDSRRYQPEAQVHIWMMNVVESKRDYVSAEVEIEERPPAA